MLNPPSEDRAVWIYPFDFAPTEDFSDYCRDERGVPLVFYPHLQRWVYNPITISQFGLAQISHYAKQDDEHAKKLAGIMADWLVENLEEWKTGIGAWVFRFDLPLYGPVAPWISAMAQGQGLSLLLRASRLLRRPAYEEASHHAVRAFYHSMDEGGVARTFPDGSLAFEEYTTAEPSLVLNGMLFALLGLHDYAENFNDARAQERFDAGLAGVKANLWRYDTGYWNHYDLHRSRRLTSPDYMRIHIQLLRIFAGLVEDEYFAGVAQKWEKYLNNSWCRAQYLAVKCVEKIRLRFGKDFGRGSTQKRSERNEQ
jgi:hypothetical protein